MSAKVYKVGLIGYGGFGQFLHHCWSQLDQVRVIAIADEDLFKMEGLDSLKTYTQWQDILEEELDIISVVTPPHKHSSIAIACLKAGHNVLIEKPLAIEVSEAQEIIAVRNDTKGVAGIDFMMRFNPLLITLKRFMQQGVFGQLRRVVVENYAQDSTLPQSHWFWNRSYSGGILIEHGVHFIDLIHFLCDNQPVEISGLKHNRNPQQEDRIMANILYDDGVIATHYHAFSRPGFFETTHIKLAFDLADLELHGWIPINADVRVLVNADTKSILLKDPLFSFSHTVPLDQVRDESRPSGWGQSDDEAPNLKSTICSGGIRYAIDEMISGQLLTNQTKKEVYTKSVQQCLLDVLRKTVDQDHSLTVPLEAGLKSLKVAVAATESARTGKKMIYILWPLLIISLFFMRCTSPVNISVNELINTAHLDHLYEEIQVENTPMGAIWIYSESPDYHLVGDEDEGFTCVDDVARALVFYTKQYSTTPTKKGLARINSLTEFLLFMQAENGYFYNFLLPGPKVNTTHQNSKPKANWWTWRAFWALSEVALIQEESIAALQNRCLTAMDYLMQNMERFCLQPEELIFFEGVAIPKCLTEIGSDQVAVLMMALGNYYRIVPSESIKSLLLRLGDLLVGVSFGNEHMPPHYAFMSWKNHWHAWGNLQAYALLYTGRTLSHNAFIQAGLNEVQHFYPFVMEQGFISSFSVIAEAQQVSVHEIKSFGQIAYGIRPMVYAALEAYKITGKVEYAVSAGELATWLFGNNPAGQPMYDPATGRTYDGIESPVSVNINSGAESTIEGLLMLQAVWKVPAAREVLDSYINTKKIKGSDG